MKQTKEKYLSVTELINLAKKQGVDFGKSDPYNRLRYYTKIGLLPNMIRLGSQGHYEVGTLEKLIRIEQLKSQGWENDKIKKEFEREHLVVNLDPKNLSTWKRKILAVLVGAIFVLGFYQATVSKTTSSVLANQKTGTHTVLPLEKNTFVFDKRVQSTSKIFISFSSAYPPSTTYYIASKIPGIGFEVALSSPTVQETKFDYWIVE